MTKTTWGASASRLALLAMAVSAPAAASWAQGAAAPPESSTTLGEVIVTAQKRSENVQKTPLAVTSLGAATLATAHVVGATDLERVVPDLTVDVGGGTGDPGAGSAVFSIRGLGASATGTQGSAGVAVHFDGVYRQDGISNSEFFDLERIEVDPGPQGTLYGRSAAAGAVNVIPAKPGPVFGADATLEVGNYGEIRTEGMINVPVSGALSARLAFQTQNHDGYSPDGYDDLDAKALRFQALYKPDGPLSARLLVSYLNLGGRGSGSVFTGGPALAGNAGTPSLTALFPQLGDSNLRKRSIAQDCLLQGQVVASCAQSIHIDKYSAHLEIGYNLGWGILTVLPAYSESDQKDLSASAPLPLSIYNQTPYNNVQYSLEARLSDPGRGPLKWVAGVNLYTNAVEDDVDEHINILTNINPAPGVLVPAALALNAYNNLKARQDSYAAFGQGTYSLRPWLRLTGGVRYNYDSDNYHGTEGTNSQTLYIVNGPLLAQLIPSPITTGPLTASVSFHDVTYKVAVDADVTPTSLIYASVGTGYKPGGLNDGGPPSTNTPESLAFLGSQLGGLTAVQLAAYEPSASFGPEKVTHYEVGTKNRFWNGRLQINDAAYYDDYSGYQNGATQVTNPLLYRSQGFVVTNAGRAQVYGNELSVTVKLTPRDLLDISANYLHAKFVSYVAPAYLTPSGVVPAINYSGYVLPNAPEFSGNVTYQHTFDLSNGDELTASAFTHITQGYWVYFAEADGTHQSAYTNTTLDLTWRSASRRWRASAFVNNLEDNDVKTFGIITAGYSEVHLAPPRTYGASLTVRY